MKETRQAKESGINLEETDMDCAEKTHTRYQTIKTELVNIEENTSENRCIQRRKCV